MAGYDPALASPALPAARPPRPALAAAVFFAAVLLLWASPLSSVSRGSILTASLQSAPPTSASIPVAARPAQTNVLVQRREALFSAALLPLLFGGKAGATSTIICDDQAVSHLVGPGGQEVYLVGTAHISNISAQLVRTVIREVQPDTVMVELDASRFKKFGLDGSGTKEKPPSLLARLQKDLFDGALPWGQRVQKVQADLLGAALSQFYQALDRMGFNSGQEFAVAVAEARAINAALLLGDQPVDTTLQRLQQALAATDLGALLASPAEADVPIDVSAVDAALFKGDTQQLAGAVELMKQRGLVRDLLAQMRADTPEIYRALVQERDAYMARSIAESAGRRFVAVVGMAHMDGIEQALGYSRAAC
eukprot:EG_transcript_12631